MSGGFCPDDWHGTTEADLQQMSWGEDYHYWADVSVSDQRLRQREYAIHDAAIAQAKSEGLTFHLLSAAEQMRRMDEAALAPAPTEPLQKVQQLPGTVAGDEREEFACAPCDGTGMAKYVEDDCPACGGTGIDEVLSQPTQAPAGGYDETL